ncbi:hypothetical protein KNP414_06219 [Paenibacillus mucilaginosus KNP414]|uniref:Uncharacterized protein n=1 Tax=Paenibacillus mucilaginosus (strain KNP414) TaxID=1036673 RepID=F8FIJ9_PAEMK|nr:hypothetical protein KNP414_06219 [Paenibacillus mucilaginosus KNP414]
MKHPQHACSRKSARQNKLAVKTTIQPEFLLRPPRLVDGFGRGCSLVR